MERNRQPSPEQPPRRVLITIERDLGAIEPERSCYSCDQPMQPTYVVYEQAYTESGKPALAYSDRVPGYGCGNCGVEAFELQASILILRAAHRLVEAAGDAGVARQVKASLDAGLQQVARLAA